MSNQRTKEAMSNRRMKDAVFLSASVPDPRRHERYHSTADVMAIRAAVSAFVNVVLGRIHLVWGGHPSITPMVWLVARSLGVDYSRAVTLYQSRFFEEDFPEENRRFKNVVYTPAVPGDMPASLAKMRNQMLTERKYTAGVFIGGMEG
jgi:hypothetical protein